MKPKPVFPSSAIEVVEHCRKYGVVLYADHVSVQLPPYGEFIQSPDDPIRVRCTTSRQKSKDGAILENLIEALPQNVGADSEFKSRASNIHVSKGVLEELNTQLVDDTSAVRRISSWPINRSFVCLDVSDFSAFSPGQQVSIVKTLNGLVGDLTSSCPTYKDSLEAQLCIGDGYIYVFRCPTEATFFAARLAVRIESYAADVGTLEFHFRAGVHCGDVFCFWDTDRKDWNYIGRGINGGARVLQAVGKDSDDVVFVSSEIRQEFISEAQIEEAEKRAGLGEYQLVLENLENKGRKKDKHGNLWRVYLLKHMEVARILAERGK